MRYWEERAREWQKARDKKSAKLTADLVRAYRKAAEELQKEIFAWYEKYATAEGVTLADAKKALSTDELKKLKSDLATFEKLAKENGKHAHDKVLTKMSAAVHVSRLESLQLQMRYILYELYKNVDDELTDTLKSFYADERERMAYETQLARGEFEQIATTDEKRIERVLKTPWATDGKDFSSRLWTNREQLVGTLQAEITRALITGDDSASVGKAIAKKLNASLYAASRVAQTEITRVTTESDKDTFAEMDVEEVEVIGTLDLKTCGTCGDMDSKHMTRDEAVVGITAPPFHPNCRCQLVPYDKDFPDEYRLMRDPLTGKNKVIKNMSFNEWKEKYVTDEVKETLKALKPLKINRPRDTTKEAMEKNLKPPTDDFIKSIAEKRGKPYTVGKKGEDRFYDDNGKPIYPLNNGAVGEEKEVTLHAGTFISRYGADTGKFASPLTVTLEERALPRETREAQLHVYEVVADITCYKSRTAAWFGQKGGGTQYRFEEKMIDLIEESVLIEKDT